jgi:hypothetical protein
MRATTFQSAKIKEVGEALVATGHVSLDEQATVLGLSRSTTWTILQANHKKKWAFGVGDQTNAGPAAATWAGAR